MYDSRIFEGPLNVVITDVRDVALFVGVLGAGKVVLVLQDAGLVTAPLLAPQKLPIGLVPLQGIWSWTHSGD